MWAQGGQVLDRSRTWSSGQSRGTPEGIPHWNPGYVVASDPRWQGTREQEKRRRLAKKFYLAFRHGEDDETGHARLAKMLPTTYREESTSAGSQNK